MLIDQVITKKRGGTCGGLVHITKGLATPTKSFDDDLKKLNGREDATDFALLGLLTILAKHADSEALSNCFPLRATQESICTKRSQTKIPRAAL